MPALSAELLRVGQGAGTYILKAANASGETGFGRNTGLNHLKVGNIEIPTDPDGSIFIKFRRSNPAAFIPAWKVLSGELSQADVAGRIVLVGTSAPGLLDLRATPLSPAIPGVEIHAQVLEHILAGRSLVRPDYALAIEETCTGPSPRCNSSIRQRSLGCGLRSVHRSRFSPWRLAYVSRWGSSHRHRLSDFGPRLHCRCNNIYVYRGVETQRTTIRPAFGRCLAPEVIEEIIADPNKLERGGEVRELTLMFCDVRNFTSISEQLSAAELTHFVNELLKRDHFASSRHDRQIHGRCRHGILERAY